VDHRGDDPPGENRPRPHSGPKIGAELVPRLPRRPVDIRREFRGIVAAELNHGKWTPREMRHGVVSLLSDADVSAEDISQLVGHSGTFSHRERLPPPSPAGDPARGRCHGQAVPAGIWMV